ncbi:uncharacterized protein LOC122031765 [Zingiber officinale]|uniref:uncharacterized protein LOC122031765 n=1 Tax=Zingiber officinale TaxID=94328 RepID=UPI001C4C857E|nr:uncharacterized protein LOC122031765 [Zingiber officinale]
MDAVDRISPTNSYHPMPTCATWVCFWPTTWECAVPGHAKILNPACVRFRSVLGFQPKRASSERDLLQGWFWSPPWFFLDLFLTPLMPLLLVSQSLWMFPQGSLLVKVVFVRFKRSLENGAL